MLNCTGPPDAHIYSASSKFIKKHACGYIKPLSLKNNQPGYHTKLKLESWGSRSVSFNARQVGRLFHSLSESGFPPAVSAGGSRIAPRARWENKIAKRRG